MAASATSTSSAASSSAASAASARAPSGAGRSLVGHTCAWKVSGHLTRATFEDLKRFCGLAPNLAATISRKQLEIAVRRASASSGRNLRLVQREIVDATKKGASELPVVARVNSGYVLERNQMRPGSFGVWSTLERCYSEEQGTIHTTVAAGVVKRYVRRSLSGFSLRDHGGIYFVSQKLEEGLFRLADFLRSEGIGHITHFGVGNEEHETGVLTGEIRRGVEAEIEKIREAFREADLAKARDRTTLRKKVRKMRAELSEKRDLFGFAQKTLEKKDAQVRSLMRDIIRGTRTTEGAGLFSEDASFAGEEAPTGGHSGQEAAPSGDGQVASGGSVPEIDFAA